MPTIPAKKKAASTINRTASLESVHLLHQGRKFKRQLAPGYMPVPAQSRYGYVYTYVWKFSVIYLQHLIRIMKKSRLSFKNDKYTKTHFGVEIH